MKKLIVILIAAVCLNSFTVTAGSPSIVKSTDKSFSVFFDDWNESDLTVQLKDLTGFVLMTDNVTDEKVTGKKYNLKNLPTGDYVLEISGDQKVMTQALSLNDEEVTISDNSDLYYAPTVTIDEDKLDLNVLSLSKDVEVQIRDQEGNVVFKTDLGSQISVNKRFDLSQLDNGEYAISVYQNGYKHKIKFVL